MTLDNISPTDRRGPGVPMLLSQNIVRFLLTLFASSIFFNCNNYDLLDKLENPGGTNSGKLYAFVSSLTTFGDMTGLATGGCGGTGVVRADCACTDLAQAAGLRKNSSGKFVAWLSTTTLDMTCRINGVNSNNCANTGGPTWYNTMDEVIAVGYADLFDMNISAPIKYTESKGVPAAANVWSGTEANGLRSGAGAIADNCTDWGLNAGTGSKGDIGATALNWSYVPATSCAAPAIPVYCFAVP